MAKVFLDANYFVDAVVRRPEKQILDSLLGHMAFVSVLTFHIYCYIYKIKIPNFKLITQKEKFQAVEFSHDILEKALAGPTADFEDNVQLHSAAQADCDLFLTSDLKLLDMKFFGKSKIAQTVSSLART